MNIADALVLLDGADEIIMNNENVRQMLAFLYCGSRSIKPHAQIHSAKHGDAIHLTGVGNGEIVRKVLKMDDSYATIALLLDREFIVVDNNFLPRSLWRKASISDLYTLTKTGIKHVETYLMPYVTALRL